ncbi:hypothetical protein [Klebsiella oxytoca]|uniref:hypothetical protein n=2 Tax=Klebsiella/Raoultella group TaxID=2890311 RepID=UPI00387A4838
MKVFPLMQCLKAPSGSVPMSELMAHLDIERKCLVADIQWAYINRFLDMYISQTDELIYTLLPEGIYFQS